MYHKWMIYSWVTPLLGELTPKTLTSYNIINGSSKFLFLLVTSSYLLNKNHVSRFFTTKWDLKMISHSIPRTCLD